MNIIEYEMPTGVDAEAKTFLAQAKAYQITTPDMYEMAATDLQAIKAKQKELEGKRTEIVGPLNKAVKAINALFKPASDYLDEAERIIKGSMLAFQRAEEKKRQEAEAAAREVLRKQQEALARQAEELRRTEEELRAKQAEAEQQKAEAEAAGDAAKAAELATVAAGIKDAADWAKEDAAIKSEESALITAPTVHAPETKVSGISTRDNWKGRVTNKMELIKAVAEGRASEALLLVDEAELNRRAKALKNELNVPGCEAYNAESIAARAA